MSKIIIDIPDELYQAIYKAMDMTKNIRNTKTMESQILNNIYNGIMLPDNATNGEVIKGMFPNENIKLGYGFYYLRDDIRFSFDWWNAPYKGGE